MRIIAGTDKEYSGNLGIGTGVEIAYFAQDSAEKMSSERTVEQEAETVCPNDLIPKIRNMLGAFLFRGDDVEKPVSVLSGGERSRLALLKMLLHPANLLVLDEPTNHLDLTSKDVLLDALKSFEGTVLFVSHDRGFIEELADLVLELDSGSMPRLYHGNYAYYLEKKESLEFESPERSESESPATASNIQTWEQEKARKARLKKLKKREEEILTLLEGVSSGRKALEDAMALPATYSDGAKVKKILASLAELDEESAKLNEEWIATASEISDIDA
jgi:ATP-binding cassette subfamily F protein 3